VTDRLLAHGVGGAGDLPLPLSYVLVGAGWALAVSFAVLAFSWPASRFRGDAAGRDLPWIVTASVDSSWVRGGVRALGLVLTAYVGWAAIAGQDVTVNPVIGVFYVYLWVGMVPVSLLAGDVWPLLSPVRTVHLGLTRLLRTPPDRGVATYPSWLGYWPAAGGLFAFVWTELVDSESAFVSTVLTWLMVYGGAMLLYGHARGQRLLRLMALLLLTAATVKVFFFDLAALEQFYRIVSFLVLGAILLAVSFLYQQKQRAPKAGGG